MITIEAIQADTDAMVAAIANVNQRPSLTTQDARGRALTVHYPPNWAPGIVRRKLSGARFGGVIEAFLADPVRNGALLDAFSEQVQAVAAATRAIATRP
jgi:hypothetical protein